MLRKVYEVEKEKIYEAIENLLELENIHFCNTDTIRIAFQIYKEKNLDIVDCMLYAYYKNEHYKIATLDKKLNKLVENKA